MDFNMQDINLILTSKDELAKYLPSEILLDQQLPAGGQGIVYRGEYTGSQAAIKIYFPGQVIQRVEREIEALQMLESEFIVKLLYESKIDILNNELMLVVTELIPGDPLNIKIGEDFVDSEIAEISFGIASAIDEMWKYRIVHRDIKPSNILLKPNGSSVLIDLGIARHIDKTTLTAMGLTWGTFGYMSPEQTKSVKQLTCKSDMYSLGVVISELLLGRHPTNGDQLKLISTDFSSKLPQKVDACPFSDLIKSTLQTRPIRRIKPNEFIVEIQNYIN
jgi:eukaryotic-like serine/threonine-protein kinase